MSQGSDLWVVRDRPFEPEEVESCLSSREDFKRAEAPILGETSLGTPINIPQEGLWWWTGNSPEDEVLVSVSPDGIHFTAANSRTASIAEAVAQTLGGWVQEG